jgi:hypothetical protein
LPEPVEGMADVSRINKAVGMIRRKNCLAADVMRFPKKFFARIENSIRSLDTRQGVEIDERRSAGVNGGVEGRL